MKDFNKAAEGLKAKRKRIRVKREAGEREKSIEEINSIYGDARRLGPLDAQARVTAILRFEIRKEKTLWKKVVKVQMLRDVVAREALRLKEERLNQLAFLRGEKEKVERGKRLRDGQRRFKERRRSGDL